MPEVHEIDLPTCERLLRRGAFGRFALTTHAARRSSRSTTSSGTTPSSCAPTRRALARHAAGAPLVFEVDAVDPEYWNGFSVIARGVGELVEDPPKPGSGTPTARPWAGGDRSCEVRLRWTELTGRRVGRRGDLESLLPFGRAL